MTWSIAKRYVKTTPQQLQDSRDTVIDFDRITIGDYAHEDSDGIPGWRFVCDKRGVYQVSAGITLNLAGGPNKSDSRIILEIHKSGMAYIAQEFPVSALEGGRRTVQITDLLQLDVGEVVSIVVFQDIGRDIAIDLSNPVKHRSFVTVTDIAPAIYEPPLFEMFPLVRHGDANADYLYWVPPGGGEISLKLTNDGLFWPSKTEYGLDDQMIRRMKLQTFENGNDAILTLSLYDRSFTGVLLAQDHWDSNDSRFSGGFYSGITETSNELDTPEMGFSVPQTVFRIRCHGRSDCPLMPMTKMSVIAFNRQPIRQEGLELDRKLSSRIGSAPADN